jgi:hypothetical protein
MGHGWPELIASLLFTQGNCLKPPFLGGSINGESTKWMVYFMENPIETSIFLIFRGYQFESSVTYEDSNWAPRFISGFMNILS